MIRGSAYLALVLWMCACAPEDWGPEALSSGTNTDDETLQLGHESYELYCSGCHGVQGDGQGPAAGLLDPPPRDFRVGKLKFATVPSGQSPHDADYLRVITNGLAGTAMPTFRYVPLQERQAIVTYLQTFRAEVKAGGETVMIPKDPYRKKPAKGVAQGERLFHGLAACSSCHPAYVTPDKVKQHLESFDMSFKGMRANAYKSETKDSDWGYRITPPDFLTKRIKTGSAKESIVVVIAAGVTGTAMPNWSASLTPKQLWALAYYVESLAALRGSNQGRSMHQQLMKEAVQ